MQKSLPMPYMTQLATVGALSILVFVCAIFVVYTKHVGRQLFTELQMLEKDIESLQIEWSQLLLEQGTWSSDARLEKVARERLQLVLPEPNQVVIMSKSNSPMPLSSVAE